MTKSPTLEPIEKKIKEIIINPVLWEIKRAFTREPLIVPKSLAKRVSKENLFIKNTQYVEEHQKEMINGEIGIFNGRRIVINLPVPKLPSPIVSDKLKSKFGNFTDKEFKESVISAAKESQKMMKDYIDRKPIVSESNRVRHYSKEDEKKSYTMECKHKYIYNGGLEMKCELCGKVISQ